MHVLANKREEGALGNKINRYVKRIVQMTRKITGIEERKRRTGFKAKIEIAFGMGFTTRIRPEQIDFPHIMTLGSTSHCRSNFSYVESTFTQDCLLPTKCIIILYHVFEWRVSFSPTQG